MLDVLLVDLQAMTHATTRMSAMLAWIEERPVMMLLLMLNAEARLFTPLIYFLSMKTPVSIVAVLLIDDKQTSQDSGEIFSDWR